MRAAATLHVIESVGWFSLLITGLPRVAARIAAALAVAMLVASGGVHALVHGDARMSLGQVSAPAAVKAHAAPTPADAPQPGVHDCGAHDAAHLSFAAPAAAVLPEPSLGRAAWFTAPPAAR